MEFGIRQNPWDEETIASSLDELADALRSSSSEPCSEIVAFIPDVLPLLLQCMRNIDEVRNGPHPHPHPHPHPQPHPHARTSCEMP